MTEEELLPEARELLAKLRITYVTEGRKVGLLMSKRGAEMVTPRTDEEKRIHASKLKAFDIAIAELKTQELIED